VTLSTDKMAAIRETRPPGNLKQIREFVGLANYFRFLIKDFSKMSAPMTALTKKDLGWKEGKLPEEAYQAFLALKEKLMQQRIVAYPKREGRFMLRTDACLGDKGNVGGLGAVLLQQQRTSEDEDKVWKVIAYASRPLKKHEKNYSAYLVEMAAAVWGIEHFDVYLSGKQFTLVTDHRPLEHLGSVHTKMLNRLQHLMLEYNFTIEDRVGEDNAVADYLSRNATTTDTASVQEQVSTLNILFPEAEMDQSKDELMADIIRYMKTGNAPEKAQTQYKDRIKRLAHNSFLDEENSLWYRLPWKTRERISFWTPRHMRKELMVAAHVSIEAGHGGVARTVARLQSNYYWPGMSNVATNFVKRAGHASCQRRQSRQNSHYSR
jgi:hypothetical protein